MICDRLGLKNKPSIKQLQNFIRTYKNPDSEIKIAMCVSILNYMMLIKVLQNHSFMLALKKYKGQSYMG